MYKSRQIVNDTGTYAENIERLKETLTETDVLVIGAGAGNFYCGRIHIQRREIQKYFYDFEEKYGFHDMYSGGFYSYDTLRRVLGLLEQIHNVQSLCQDTRISIQ